MYCTTSHSEHTPMTPRELHELEVREDIWNRKSQLQLIYHHARNTHVSPWAVLASVVAYRLGCVPSQMVAHDGSSLNSGAVIVGGPGSGKTIATGVAEELGGTPSDPLRNVSPSEVTSKSVSACTYNPATTPVRGIRILRSHINVYNEDVRALRIADFGERDALRSILRGEWALPDADERALTKNSSRVCMVQGAFPTTAQELISVDEGRLAASMLWAPSQDGVDRSDDRVGTPSPLTSLRFSVVGMCTSYLEAKVGDPAREVIRVRAADNVPSDDGLRCVVSAGLAQVWGADPITLDEWELAGHIIALSRSTIQAVRNSTV